MPTIFAATDMATLISTFPPPLPTKDHPSLIPSMSDNKLLNSHHIQRQFHSLLQTETDRMKRSGLPTILGIKDIQWLLDQETMHYSKDRSSLIPQPEIDRVTKDLLKRANNEFVLLDRFSTDNDVSYDSMSVLTNGLRLITTTEAAERGRSKMFAGSEALVAKTSNKIKSAISDLEADKVDLTTLLPNVPSPVLLEVAKRTLGEAGGEIASESSGSKIVFIPAAYKDSSEEKQAAEFEARAQELQRRLETNGFYEHPREADPEGTQARSWYRERHPDAAFESIDSPATRIVLLKPALDKAMQEMKDAVTSYADQHPAVNDGKINATLHDFLFQKSTTPKLVELILRTDYKKQIERAFSDAIADRDRKIFESLLSTAILAPLQLYILATETIFDPALRARIDERLLDHVRQDTLPLFEQTIHSQDLLRQDKRRGKELEKTLKSRDLATSLSELNTSISTFSRKQKIPHPDRDQIAAVKRTILTEKAKSIAKMARASDVLQHLIWLLLACKSDGLFMSSGKDTSRMIKLYRTVGDEETAAKLEGWRDSVKREECSDAELRDMQALATRSVEERYVEATALVNETTYEDG
ncbi:hypothetical protein LTR09_009628 [Extremus antarcticus]|uniref:Uncharacterized protein n=1 Tax=Extremus antarcticus TaxID=702011 RepID=A0AAJ0D8F3_9PEZI|nr:hypothetical protein LTR09_009628 [Extremus antarcticus]